MLKIKVELKAIRRSYTPTRADASTEIAPLDQAT